MKILYRSLILICLSITFIVGMESCKTKKVTQKAEFGEVVKSDTLEMTIYHHKVDAMGVGPMKCLKVKYGDNEPWQVFCSEIKGFDHKEGYQYKILVRRDELANPPQDASKYVYTFLELKQLKMLRGQ